MLRLERRFAAPREAVFDAWTDPEVLRRWWAAAPGWAAADVEVDLRVGGRYRLAMRGPRGEGPHVVAGEYVEVRRPERIAYTWTWEGDPPEMRGSAGTLVTVEFEDDGRGGTRVVLTHAGFAGPGIAAEHVQGWTACLDNLERRVLAPAAPAGDRV